MSSGIKSAIETLENAIVSKETTIALLDREDVCNSVESSVKTSLKAEFNKEIGEHKAALAILVTIDIATGENHA